MEGNIKTITSLEENLDVIYGALYLPRLTTYLEDLISFYVDAYYEVLARCTNSPMPSAEDMHLLQLLSGPINELYNPENERLTNGQRYPAVDIILNKIDEHNISNSNSNSKSYTRSLTKAYILPLIDDSNMGFLDIAFIFGIITISIVFLVYVTILLLK